MASYIGVRCPICEKKFDNSDDIVVCPACGAPHHRGCYMVKNECAFASDHISGRVWLPPQDKTQENKEASAKACTSCGAEIPVDALFCHICGHHVISAAKPADTRTQTYRQNPGWPAPGMDFIGDPLYAVYGGVDPDVKIEDETVRDIAAYIGPSSAYYIPRFRMIAERGRNLIPNFAALLFGFLFYFYRKSYLLGFVTLTLFIASSVPGYFYMRETIPVTLNDMAQMGFAELMEQAEIVVPPYDSVDTAAAEHYMNMSRIATTINFFISVILSVCFNRLYFDKCLKNVYLIRENADKSPSEDGAYRGELMRFGGVSKQAAAIMGLAAVIIYFVANTAILYTYIA